MFCLLVPTSCPLEPSSVLCQMWSPKGLILVSFNHAWNNDIIPPAAAAGSGEVKPQSWWTVRPRWTCRAEGTGESWTRGRGTPGRGHALPRGLVRIWLPGEVTLHEQGWDPGGRAALTGLDHRCRGTINLAGFLQERMLSYVTRAILKIKK